MPTSRTSPPGWTACRCPDLARLRQIKAAGLGPGTLDLRTETTAMAASNHACRTSGRRPPLHLVVGVTLVALTTLAACHRPVPPNVTPPGETAAFSEPSPAASAARETEIPK